MRTKEQTELEVLKEIRDLLVLVAAKIGASNAEVAKVLSCGQSTLRKKVSFAETKKR